MKEKDQISLPIRKVVVCLLNMTQKHWTQADQVIERRRQNPVEGAGQGWISAIQSCFPLRRAQPLRQRRGVSLSLRGLSSEAQVRL